MSRSVVEDVDGAGADRRWSRGLPGNAELEVRRKRGSYVSVYGRSKLPPCDARHGPQSCVGTVQVVSSVNSSENHWNKLRCAQQQTCSDAWNGVYAGIKWQKLRRRIHHCGYLFWNLLVYCQNARLGGFPQINLWQRVRKDFTDTTISLSWYSPIFACPL